MTNVVLVVDMVKGFLEDGYNLYCGDEARNIIPEIQKILENELANKSHIIYICDSHRPDDLEFEMFPVHCIEGTEEAELIPELRKYPGEFIYKTRYSAFFETDLDEKLRKLNPDRIIVCGVCTDICILHTTADARNRDYTVQIPIAAVASFDYQAHNWALSHMKTILGAVLIGTKVDTNTY
jgi:nicotinamidase-related amidase